MRYLLLGPPGTGKTTRLIAEMLKLDCPLSDIAFVSFTKAAIEEAKRKTFDKYPHASDKTDLQGFRTLHSFCYNTMRLKRGQILTPAQLKEFEARVGSASGLAIEAFDVDSGVTERNAHLYLHHLSVNLLQTLEQVHAERKELCSLADARFVAGSYESFKQAKHVFDFNDILLYCATHAEPLNYKYVILDEAQDLTSLQWLVFERLFHNAKDIYIAGDDDQAIYTWAGVNINDFLSVKHDKKIILDQSFRIPQSAHDFSDKIAKKIKHRYEKVFKPAAHSGTVQSIIDIEDIKARLLDSVKRGETWFLLFRNNFFARNIVPALYEAGLPFMRAKSSSVCKSHIAAVKVYERLRSGKLHYPLPEADFLLLDEYASHPRDVTRDSPAWYFGLDKIDLDTREYYRAIMANGFKLDVPPKIEISTIHQAKGREADNVILFPDMTRASFDQAEHDDEHRVFYVAATRVKRNLYICEPQGVLHYDFK